MKKTILAACVAPLALFVAPIDADAAGWRPQRGPSRGAQACRFRARLNSALKGKGNPSYYDYSRAPQVKSAVKGMQDALNGRATPGYGLFLFKKQGVKVTPTKDGIRICNGGKACTLAAVAAMPTSGHVSGLPAHVLAKDQKHTLWTVAGGKGYRDKSNVLIDGAPSRGDLVTVVKFSLPLKAGVNHVYFDPYPGRTAGVGGFSEGRTHKIVVE